MTTPIEIPIACSLTPAQAAGRGDTFRQLFAAVERVEELPDAYVFTVPGEAAYLTRLVELVAAERDCCRFLEFALRFEANLGAVRLQIGGSPGAKDFVRDHFLPDQHLPAKLPHAQDHRSQRRHWQPAAAGGATRGAAAVRRGEAHTS